MNTLKNFFRNIPGPTWLFVFGLVCTYLPWMEGHYGYGDELAVGRLIGFALIIGSYFSGRKEAKENAAHYDEIMKDCKWYVKSKDR